MQGFPVLVTEEAAIFQQQRVVGNLVPQAPRKRPFVVVATATGKRHFDVRAQLDQTRLANLWESALAPAARWTTETGVRRAVWHVEHDAIDGHQSPAAIER